MEPTIDSSEQRDEPKQARQGQELEMSGRSMEEQTLDDLKEEVKKLQSALETERKNSADLSSRMKYLQADLVNLQRQSDKIVADVRIRTKLDYLSEIIGIKEDLERAVAATHGYSSLALVEGLRLVVARTEGMLRSEEVNVIKPETGSRFDPRLHEAVSFSEVDQSESEGTVLSVVKSGYAVGGKPIRPALVEVARLRKRELPPVSPNNPQGKGQVEEPVATEPIRDHNKSESQEITVDRNKNIE